MFAGSSVIRNGKARVITTSPPTPGSIPETNPLTIPIKNTIAVSTMLLLSLTLSLP